MLISAFTWLDYSEAHRRQMLDAINLLGERDTRDELGVGTIREKFRGHNKKFRGHNKGLWMAAQLTRPARNDRMVETMMTADG